MTKKASTILKEIIAEETSKMEDLSFGPSYHSIQHILRRLDFIMLFYNSDSNKSKEEFEQLKELYNYGWAPAIKPFYNDLEINVWQPFPEMFKEAQDWADGIIQSAGRLAVLNQFIAYEKADLIKITTPKENEFEFKYIGENNGLEYYDRISRDFYKDMIIERMIEEKRKKDTQLSKDEIQKKLREIIRNPSGKYISYDATPEIDEYYNKEGYYFVLRLQGYDEFGEDDKFGGIEYSKYLDLAETIVGVAIMHTEACLELTKMNPNVDLQNLLTYTFFKDKTIAIYKNYFGATEEEIEQIFSCITLNKENFEYYLTYPATALPMYVQASDNMLIRLASGCLGNPFELLNRELKRKFEKDYFVAVTKREDRFRKELFYLFPFENVIKVPKGVVINLDGRKTDIDAILFDVNTNTLGLFQLKWQDPFYKSMRERYSRISNLFKKANEWIEKVDYWLSKTDPKSIISSLKINKHYSGNKKLKLENCFVFVISRTNINYTNVEGLDERVAWGTWYQMIESQARVKTEFNDPIREAFVKLKTLTPQNRMEKEELPELEDFEMKFGKYKIYHKKKKEASR